MRPSSDGQVLAIERAWAAAGLDPARLGLLEAHGTATVAGDTTELESVQRVFGPGRRRGGGEGGRISRVPENRIETAPTMPDRRCRRGWSRRRGDLHGVRRPTLHCKDPHALLGAGRFELGGPGP